MNIISTIDRIQHLLLETFNTRELAALTWILIAICLAMFKSSLRRSIFGVIKALFIWKFIIIYALAFAYIWFIVIQLEKLGLWNPFLLKDTIYWSVLSGTVLMYKVGQSKEPLVLLKSILIASVQFSVVIQFIANLETFSFWLEFAAIPLIILFAGMYAVSEHHKEHELVKRTLERAGIIFSVIALGYIIYFSATNYEKYSNAATVKQFILPIILTLCFTPILAILNLVVQYEDVSTSLKRFAKNKRQYHYMLFSALLYFNFNIKGLIRWLQSMITLDLQSKEAIKASMKQIRLQQKEEKIPPEYPELEGWLPKYAKDFLIHHDLGIKDYSSELGNLWVGKSNKLKLDKDSMTGDCAYSIHGAKYVVKNLKLHLRAFDSTRTQDLDKFIHIVDALYQHSLYAVMPHKIRSSILSLKNLEYKDELGDISVRINKWKNEKRGYDLYIDIKHWGSLKTD